MVGNDKEDIDLLNWQQPSHYHKVLNDLLNDLRKE